MYQRGGEFGGRPQARLIEGNAVMMCLWQVFVEDCSHGLAAQQVTARRNRSDTRAVGGATPKLGLKAA